MSLILTPSSIALKSLKVLDIPLSCSEKCCLKADPSTICTPLNWTPPIICSPASEYISAVFRFSTLSSFLILWPLHTLALFLQKSSSLITLCPRYNLPDQQNCSVPSINLVSMLLVWNLVTSPMASLKLPNSPAILANSLVGTNDRLLSNKLCTTPKALDSFHSGTVNLNSNCDKNETCPLQRPPGAPQALALAQQEPVPDQVTPAAAKSCTGISDIFISSIPPGCTASITPIPPG